ncbi:MAG: hypothetical protein Q4E74_09005 [Ruminococcus sp.]|nr:hypothetical protein [Ruminococcus sp.]
MAFSIEENTSLDFKESDKSYMRIFLEYSSIMQVRYTKPSKIHM